MRLPEGRAGLQRMILAFGRIADECERRAATGGPPSLAALGAEARATAAALEAGDQRKEDARAAFQDAGHALAALHGSASEQMNRAKAQLFALYGYRTDELAAFGVGRPPGRPPGAHRRAKKGGTSTETTTATTATTDTETK